MIITKFPTVAVETVLSLVPRCQNIKPNVNLQPIINYRVLLLTTKLWKPVMWCENTQTAAGSYLDFSRDLVSTLQQRFEQLSTSTSNDILKAVHMREY